MNGKKGRNTYCLPSFHWLLNRDEESLLFVLFRHKINSDALHQDGIHTTGSKQPSKMD